MKVLKIVSIIILGIFMVQGINTPTMGTVNKDGEVEHHPVIAFLTDLSFEIIIAIPLIYIALN